MQKHGQKFPGKLEIPGKFHTSDRPHPHFRRVSTVDIFQDRCSPDLHVVYDLLDLYIDRVCLPGEDLERSSRSCSR